MFQSQIETCEECIDAELDQLAQDGAGEASPPDSKVRERALRERLHRMLGVDLVAIPTVGVGTALTFAAEIGPDLSRFPSQGNFCSWLCLAPPTHISGDKRLKATPTRQTNRVGQALRMAASTARNSRTAVGAAHRRRMHRMDTARAVKATAHQLGWLIYAMLTHGQEYVERDLAEMEAVRRE